MFMSIESSPSLPDEPLATEQSGVLENLVALADVSICVPGFLPGLNGFRFPNRFAKAPILQFVVLGVEIGIGNTANGLCGGMVFAARDFFEAGKLPPSLTEAPVSGALFQFMVKRLFHSFSLPRGPLRYLHLMNPKLPDRDTMASKMGLLPHGRSRVMVYDEWPLIQADLDAGRLCPLALVLVQSLSPKKLSLNHQVLAYGYRLEGTRLSILVYDPNHPGHDEIRIVLEISSTLPSVLPQSVEARLMVPAHKSQPVYCFFRTHYRFVNPVY
jgi:hypothetical protein